MLYNSKRRSGVLRAKTKGSERFVYLPAANGPVVQLVRTLACHARGRRFEPVPGRHYAAMAQSVERVLGKDEVSSSNLDSSSKFSPGILRFLGIFVIRSCFIFYRLLGNCT